MNIGSICYNPDIVMRPSHLQSACMMETSKWSVNPFTKCPR